MAVKVKFKVTLPTKRLEGDLPGFLDMLRYEGGRVVDWGHYDGEFAVYVEVDDYHRHKPGRWASFGIAVTGEEFN